MLLQTGFRWVAVFSFLTLLLFPYRAQPQQPAVHLNAAPSPRPDRIILSWVTNPTTSFAVTWRTDSSVKTPKAAVAVADASPFFPATARELPAASEALHTASGAALYHHVNFTDLKPNTLYAYRVGDGNHWSEWFQFRTANDQPESFSFLYFGDAQTEIFSLWSRTFRAAYAAAPHAKFMLHAGDLVNNGADNVEWQEWFAAGGFIPATVPSLPAPGNHEYPRRGLLPALTPLWQPQFTLPQNGIPPLSDTNYFVDYQNARVIVLNSMAHVPAQAAWLEKVLKENPQRWTFVTFHYPVFSASARPAYGNLQKHWQPIFDKYKVDLVLQGHDHNYARGTPPKGVSRQDGLVGPVYVVSVSGPKMYPLTPDRWMDRAAENTQLYQIITVNNDRLVYESRTVTGEVYDAFELRQQPGQPNILTELLPAGHPERRLNNTLPRPAP